MVGDGEEAGEVDGGLLPTLLHRYPALALAVPVEQLARRAVMLTGGLAALPVTW